MEIPAIPPRHNDAIHIYAQASALCMRVTYVAVNCLKRFSLGVAVAFITTPLTGIVVIIAQRVQRVDYTAGLEEGNKILKELAEHPRSLATLFICVIGPLAEELLFRGLIQDVLLKRLPKYVIKKILPGRETLLDTRVAIVARILITATLFSLAHKSNTGTLPGNYVKAQLIATFFGGICLGVLKETRLGLIGSIGAHAANNTFAMIKIFYF